MFGGIAPEADAEEEDEEDEEREGRPTEKALAMDIIGWTGKRSSPVLASVR